MCKSVVLQTLEKYFHCLILYQMLYVFCFCYRVPVLATSIKNQLNSTVVDKAGTEQKASANDFKTTV